MKLEEFNFELEDWRIAQTPLEKRDESKLLVIDKKTGKTEDKIFKDILDYLNPGDTLVVNNTKVLPARIFGAREGKDEEIETLLLKEVEKDQWECLVRPGKKMKLGTEIFYGNSLKGEVVKITEDGSRIIKFSYDGIFIEVLEKIGTMPLPPYITEKLEDQNRYQTIYSKEKGSAAAPTAGLHFTEELLKKILKKGIETVEVTLHIGLGTFRPVFEEEIEDHKMHSEWYFIDEKACDIINKTKENEGRIIAVGTTALRVLESLELNHGKIHEYSGWTDIFITPGYEFQLVDALITNFHLPKSTLFMLVSAFSSLEIMKNAYEIAKEKDYRFFSFGDACFIE